MSDNLTYTNQTSLRTTELKYFRESKYWSQGKVFIFLELFTSMQELCTLVLKVHYSIKSLFGKMLKFQAL